MKARVYSPTLEEWFFMYMLRKWWSENFFVTGHLRVDVTDLARAYRERGKLPPYTAILLKAFGMVAARHPAINRMVLKTFYGDRIVQFDDVKICFPILYKVSDSTHLRIETVENPQNQSISEIRNVIRKMRAKEIAKDDIAQFYLKRKNNFLNRAVLKFFYFLMGTFPSFSVPRGLCGLGLSSNAALNDKGFSYSPAAVSPAAVHVTLGSIETTEDGREFLPLGLCYNHLACRGDEAQLAVQALWQLLSGKEGLEPFLEEPRARRDDQADHSSMRSSGMRAFLDNSSGTVSSGASSRSAR